MRPLFLQESFRSALVEIWAHKLRSTLTLTGVTLGTAAMVVLLTLMAGVREMVWEGIQGLGFDGVMFVSGSTPKDPFAQKKLFQSRGLGLRDRELLSREATSLSHVAAVRIAEKLVQAGGVRKRVPVYAVTASYAQVHDRRLSVGRFFHEGDEEACRRVAVLGAALAQSLFGSQTPVGRTVLVGDVPFLVIGVEAEIGNRFANSGWTRWEMEGVLVPLSTFRAYLAGGEGVSLISLRVKPSQSLAAVQKEVERLLRRSHHGIEDFEVENIAEEMLKAEKEVRVMLRNWTIVLASIALISLLVGGVGIYSVLRISLAERVYEIGLRKAIGASDGAILVQVLLESAVLSLVGALAGVGLGVGVTRAAAGAFEAGLPVSFAGLAFAVVFALGVGLLSGLLPARTAAHMSPVEAMRG